jgi:hypothetical protein
VNLFAIQVSDSIAWLYASLGGSRTLYDLIYPYATESAYIGSISLGFFIMYSSSLTIS